MLLGVTATVVAACFCLGPMPVPEQVPVAPDAYNAPIRAAVPADAIPERCLSTARAWSHSVAPCPRMPVLEEPFIRAGARPFVLSRIR